MKRFTIVTLVLSTTVAFLVGLMLAGEFTPAPAVFSAARPAPAPERIRPAGVIAPLTVVNFADVAERVNAAVVNIEATGNVAGSREPQRYFRSNPVEPPDGPAPRESDAPRQGSGSGFIIDRAGFILTNNHVIESAQRITVTLADGRTFRGEVVGADAAIDVALLHVDGGNNLPEAPIGDSDELRVGEWVCAIGNPLGYVHSVTVGVVSFIGRKLFDPSLDDYIQTDAAINLGNSGGPLINARGQVIGINAAISSKASNIGFAVPINQAIAVVPQLKANGHVSRGFIGVTLTDVTPSLQRALGLAVSRGALVQDVSPSSPAERAGLRPYDVIVDVDDRAVSSNEELIRDISGRQPGTVSHLGIVRDGRRQRLTVKLAERPRRGEEFGTGANGVVTPSSPRPASPERVVPLGVAVRELDRTFLGRLEIPESVRGVLVTSVDPTGAAHQVLRRGLIIMEINRHSVTSVAEYERFVAAAKPGDVLAVYYYDPTLGQRTLTTVTVE
jgi:serine protease Do